MIKTTFSSIVSLVSSWVFSSFVFSSSAPIMLRCITLPMFKLKIQSCAFLTPSVFRTLSLNLWSYTRLNSSRSWVNEIFSFFRYALKLFPYFFSRSRSRYSAVTLFICWKSLIKEQSSLRTGSAFKIIDCSTLIDSPT